MTKQRALAELGLDWRRLDGLIRLCSPERHHGSRLAIKATAFLQSLRDEWSACERPENWAEQHRHVESRQEPIETLLHDDPISDLWAAG